MTKIVAFLAYYLGLDLVFYCLNRRKKRIVTFHNILPDELFRPGVANGVSMTVSRFNKVIELCQKRFHITNDLFLPGTVTLTFDDGYHNQFAYAYPILHKKGLPAYIFVAGRLLVENESLMVDKLLHWIQEAPLEKIKGGNRMEFWEQVVWPAFLRDASEKGASVFRWLDKVYPYSRIVESLPRKYCEERLRGIAQDELRLMSGGGWRIGWHTYSHFPLSKLGNDEVVAELTAPAWMKGNCLSYPYGEQECVSSRVVAICESLGFPCAVSNSLEDSALHDLFFMPRMTPSSDKILFHFEMSGLKYFLKHLSLLPGVRHD